jgi:ankyrin repeat protein
MNSNWIHRMDVEGKTPLDRAFETGHRTIAEMLLRREEEQSTEGEEDQAPLHRAAALGLDTAVKSLITCGLSPDATDTNGQTALHLAVRAGHTQVVEVLIPTCDVNVVDYEGMTPLHWASIVGNTEIAELLIAQGGDPSVPNDLMDGVNTTQLAGLMQYDELSTALDSRESFV